MKFLITIEDTVTVGGPGVDVRFHSDPPTQPEALPDTMAKHLALMAVGVIDTAITVGDKMNGKLQLPDALTKEN